jgi:type-F conjugative transfer system pilin assembly protein TrbC
VDSDFLFGPFEHAAGLCGGNRQNRQREHRNGNARVYKWMQYVRPTMQWIQQALIKEPGCKPTPERPCDLYKATIQIDPEIFSRYGIEEVPAFVYAQGVGLLNPETSDGMKEKAHWVLTGDMSLGYALEMFHRETKADTLAGVIKSLQGEYGRRK